MKKSAKESKFFYETNLLASGAKKIKHLHKKYKFDFAFLVNTKKLNKSKNVNFDCSLPQQYIYFLNSPSLGSEFISFFIAGCANKISFFEKINKFLDLNKKLILPKKNCNLPAMPHPSIIEKILSLLFYYSLKNVLNITKKSEKIYLLNFFMKGLKKILLKFSFLINYSEFNFLLEKDKSPIGKPDPNCNNLNKLVRTFIYIEKLRKCVRFISNTDFQIG